MQPAVSTEVQHHTNPSKYADLEGAVQLKLRKSSCCLVKSSNSSLVVCVFYKILRADSCIVLRLRYRFSDVYVEFKLCKLVKVSNKSSDFVRFSQSKPYPRLCLKSPTGRVTNITHKHSTERLSVILASKSFAIGESHITLSEVSMREQGQRNYNRRPPLAQN